MTIAFFVALAFLYYTTLLDVRATTRGLAKKLAVEGNHWITALFGVTPTPTDLYLANALFSLPMVAAGVAGIILDGNPGFLGVSIGSMVAYGLKHISGARAWAKLGA